ncbi:UNVERIFIED_CONTAM: hypothetical protein FKN15_016930 [Acipenser sinensis]
MENSRLWLRVVVCCVLLSVTSGAESNDLETRALTDFYRKDPNLTNEKQLLGALQEVLEKLQSKRVPAWEKKFGQVPTVTIPALLCYRAGAERGNQCISQAKCRFDWYNVNKMQ